ncbi:hypothetical protein GCM10027060_05170 [Nesterenkonia halophila]
MNRRYRFLLTPRWLGWLALCVLFAVACSFLAQWQMDRREQAVEEIDRVVTNYDAAPVRYASVRESFVDPAADDEWTVVEMTGSYRPQDMRLARNRSNGGSVGYEQLVPFAVAGTDDVVIVSRGWLPTASDDGSQPATNPAPPEGTVELTMRLRPGEPAIERGAPDGQLASIDLSAYAEQIGVELMPGAYGRMAEEYPAPAQAPEQLARPSVDEGPHLSYTMQWYAFGALGFIGWGYAARLHARTRDAEALAAEEDDRHAAVAAPAQERMKQARRLERLRRGRPSDEDLEDAAVEDSLVDR